MTPNTNPHPTGRASHSAGGAWLPRLRSLAYGLLMLVVITSGILGYRIGRGESLRLSEATPDNRFVSFSLKPVEAETTSFDRFSLSLRPMQDGELLFDAEVALTLDGAAVSPAEDAPLLFTELAQGSYTLRVTLPAIRRAFESDPPQTAEGVLRVHKSQEYKQLTLTRDKDGVYLLQAPPETGVIALMVRIDQGNLVAGLSREQPIGLEAYQLWQEEKEVHVFTERLDNYGVTTGKDGQTIIAPGSGGQFIFAVRNPDLFAKQYSLSFDEEENSMLGLPLRYRIREDVLEQDTREWGEWKTAQALSTQAESIAPGEVHYYTLQWQWASGDDKLDTAIGSQQGGAHYQLRIGVSEVVPETLGRGNP